MLINRNFPKSLRFQVRRKQKERNGPLVKKDYTCWYPHRSLTINQLGECYICTCEAWLPYPVGNILEFDELAEVWTNNIAKKLQNNTKNNTTFKFCDTSICDPWAESYQKARALPYQIAICTDDSCNLRCPSCRPDMIHFNKGPIYEERKLYTDKITSLMKDFNLPVSCALGGSGEIFSSKILSDVLYNYEPNNKHRFKIKTNGTLIDNRIKDSPIMQKLSEFTISIDAGSKSVYDIVRPPANWNKLRSNLDFLRENNFQLSFNFVLQKANLYDVINFADLCEHYGAIGHCEGVNDWGTWNYETYLKQRVHQPKDELYSEWNKIKEQLLQHPWRDYLIFASNIDTENQFTYDRLYSKHPDKNYLPTGYDEESKIYHSERHPMPGLKWTYNN